MKNYFFTILFATIIIVLSILPGDAFKNDSGFSIPYFDKFVHFYMYSVLSAILYRDYFVKKLSIQFFAILGIITFSILLGGILEIVQGTLCVNRSESWADFAADAIGAGFGVFLSRFYFKNVRLRSHVLNR